MNEVTEELSPGEELIIGLVAPVGTDLGEVERKLEERLQLFNYRHKKIKLSELLTRFNLGQRSGSGGTSEILHAKMDQGNELRKQYGRADALALASIIEVRTIRASADVPENRCAFVLNQLKHPEEVRTLREVYGSGFFLLGITHSIEGRRKHLQNNKGMSLDEANDLIARDENEANQLGQHTRKTFHLADAFLSLDGSDLQTQLWRILDLLFGNTFLTPTQDEHSMFLAFGASLRSADLSRQVGAVVMREGELLSTGANDVSKYSGGQYWADADPFASDPKEQRDHVLGRDSNAQKRDEILLRVVRALDVVGEEVGDEEVLTMAKEKLGGTGILDITEFGRAVHAEMAALMGCARVGISCRGAQLFCTTFPCHNCTKHIVAGGITKVVYIEPYPKSKALDLHGDAIYVPALKSDSNGPGNKVLFTPFQGVGPRRFVDIFSLELGNGRAVQRKNKKTGHKRPFDRANATPRIPMVPTSYFEREQTKIATFVRITERMDDDG